MLLIRLLFDIAIWRRTPRDLPSSGPLLVAVMLAYIAQSTGQAAIASQGNLQGLDGVVDLVLTCAIYTAVVVVGGRTHRLAQTLLALLGTEVLLSPLTLALAAGVSATTPADPLGLVARVGLIGVLIWNVLIVAHVMRSVFESTLATGVLVAVACALLAYGFSDLWFGSTPATGG